MKQNIMFSLIIVCIASNAFCQIRMPSLFGDNMVLQSNVPINFWGWADPNEKIGIKILDQEKWVSADNSGQWNTQMLPIKPQNKPICVEISASNVIFLKNVLVGQVWLASGQSNMYMAVRDSKNADSEIAAANYPEIRLFTVELNTAQRPIEDCNGKWVVCTPQTIPTFSAVAYSFGKQLYQELSQPVGLIQSSWGGTMIESWMSKESLTTDPNFNIVFARDDNYLKSCRLKLDQYEKAHNELTQQTELAKKHSKPIPQEPVKPPMPLPQHRPSAICNAMIHPLVPFAIKGVIWYQGESNATRAYEYQKLFPAMIADWREIWKQPTMPFLFVQLANFQHPETPKDVWAELREAQLKTLSVPYTSMAVTVDVGEANDVHFKNKQEVGRRLALAALANTYEKKVPFSGPLYKSLKIDGAKIIISFDYPYGGLTCKGDKLEGFTICGKDKCFVSAGAVIHGDSVIVSSEEIKEPIAVRYGWANAPVCNLYNAAGLPASPFRTDSFELLTKSKAKDINY